MDRSAFVQYLQRFKGARGRPLTLKAARDVAARCAGVERVLNVKVDDVVTSDDKFDKVIDRVRAKFGDTRKYDYVRALKLYKSFFERRRP